MPRPSRRRTRARARARTKARSDRVSRSDPAPGSRSGRSIFRALEQVQSHPVQRLLGGAALDDVARLLGADVEAAVPDAVGVGQAEIDQADGLERGPPGRARAPGDPQADAGPDPPAA